MARSPAQTTSTSRAMAARASSPSRACECQYQQHAHAAGGRWPYLAATPYSDGSLSLFNLGHPADAAGVLTSNGSGTLSWVAGGGGGGLTMGTTTITKAPRADGSTTTRACSARSPSARAWQRGCKRPRWRTSTRGGDADLAQLGANTFTGCRPPQASLSCECKSIPRGDGGNLRNTARRAARKWHAGDHGSD